MFLLLLMLLLIKVVRISANMIINKWRRRFCPLPKNPTFIKLPGNFYKMCFVGTVALFSLWTKSFRGDQNLDPS